MDKLRALANVTKGRFGDPTLAGNPPVLFLKTGKDLDSTSRSKAAPASSAMGAAERASE